jgi:hypothetical protein
MSNRDVRDLVVAILSLGAAACSGDPVVAETAGALCDGSSDVRLAYVQSGGFVYGGYEFQAYQGWVFFAVDGTCRFWSSRDPIQGVRSGTLTPAQAATVETKTHFRQIPALSAYEDHESCPDAGGISLARGKQVVFCTCGCDPKSPPEMTDALDGANDVRQTTLADGTPIDGPLQAATLPFDPATSKGDPGPAMNAFPWPLPWSPATIAVGAQITETSGRAIDDPSERAALRALRATAESRMLRPIYVKASDGALFSLLLRDDPPVAVQTALREIPH